MKLTDIQIEKLQKLEFEDSRIKKILDAAIETWKKVGYTDRKFGNDFLDYFAAEYISQNPCCLLAGAGFHKNKGVLNCYYATQIINDFELTGNEFWEIVQGFDGYSEEGLAKEVSKIREVLF